MLGYMWRGRVRSICAGSAYVSLWLLCVQIGMTALIRSADEGHLDIVKLLLDRNANIEATDEVRPRDMMSGRGGY